MHIRDYECIYLSYMSPAVFKGAKSASFIGVPFVLGMDSFLFCGDGEYQVTPELYLSAGEIKNSPFREKQIVCNFFGKAEYKSWDREKADQLVEQLTSEGYTVLQVGSAKDPPLKGAEDLRGKTSLRELAAILQKSRLYIGVIGGIMHLARATGCPGVIICSGGESPSGFCYDYRFADDPEVCKKCRNKAYPEYSCDRDLSCTSGVSLSLVLRTVREELALDYCRLEPSFMKVRGWDLEKLNATLTRTFEPESCEIQATGEDAAGNVYTFVHRTAPGQKEATVTFLFHHSVVKFSLHVPQNLLLHVHEIIFLDSHRKKFPDLPSGGAFHFMSDEGICCSMPSNYFLLGGGGSGMNAVFQKEIPEGTCGVQIIADLISVPPAADPSLCVWADLRKLSIVQALKIWTKIPGECFRKLRCFFETPY